MIKKMVKRLIYGRCPGFAGAFPYYGTRVHFPRGSILFDAACEEGIYERDNVRLLIGLATSNSVYFDVGANIGLMALPVLHHVPECRVISFEPSPNALPFLERTCAGNPHGDRWQVVGKAVGNKVSKTRFSVSQVAEGAYDGIMHTGRVPSARQVEVDVTTIDAEWDRLGRPAVSLIKCDVEGAELGVLQGAQRCLSEQRPFVLTEWNSANLSAYGCPPDSLLSFCAGAKYEAHSVPKLAPIRTPAELRANMVGTESFLLMPL